MNNLLIIRGVFIMLSIIYLLLEATLIFAKLKQNIFLGIRTKVCH